MSFRPHVPPTAGEIVRRQQMGDFHTALRTQGLGGVQPPACAVAEYRLNRAHGAAWRSCGRDWLPGARFCLLKRYGHRSGLSWEYSFPVAVSFSRYPDHLTHREARVDAPCAAAHGSNLAYAGRNGSMESSWLPRHDGRNAHEPIRPSSSRLPVRRLQCVSPAPIHGNQT